MTTPKHHAGPYGHDYFYIDGVLYAQPGMADDSFILDDDAMLPVVDFIEPLTSKELDDVVSALMADPGAVDAPPCAYCRGSRRMDTELGPKPCAACV